MPLEGFGVATASGAESALAALARTRPDVVLSDIRMPGMDGLELLDLLRARAPDVDVLLMTAYEDMPTVARAMRDGAFDFLVKPLRPDQLLEVLARVASDRLARSRSAPPVGVADAAGYGLDTLIGRHPRMIEVYKRVGPRRTPTWQGAWAGASSALARTSSPARSLRTRSVASGVGPSSKVEGHHGIGDVDPVDDRPKELDRAGIAEAPRAEPGDRERERQTQQQPSDGRRGRPGVAAMAGPESECCRGQDHDRYEKGDPVNQTSPRPACQRQ
jgi:CheY-like chemotaxis protein